MRLSNPFRVGVLIIFLCTHAAFTRAGAPPLTHLYEVVEVTDAVYRVGPDEDVKESLRRGDEIETNDRILVSKDGRLVLRSAESAENLAVFFGETSAQLQQMDSSTRVNLHQGAVLGIIDKNLEASRFEIATPTCVASVRGTEFLVEGTGQTFHVLTARGSVAVILPGLGPADKRTLTMEAGQKIEVSSSLDEPIKVVNINTRESVRLKEWVSWARQKAGTTVTDESASAQENASDERKRTLKEGPASIQVQSEISSNP